MITTIRELKLQRFEDMIKALGTVTPQQRQERYIQELKSLGMFHKGRYRRRRLKLVVNNK